MDLRLISTPLTQAQKLAVVPLAEVKLAARVTHTREDTLIQDDIEAAYDYLSGPEGWLNGCCLLEEEWEVFLPSSFSGTTAIPLRPVRDVPGMAFEWLQSDGTYLDGEPTLISLSYRDGVTYLAGTPNRRWPYIGSAHARAYRFTFKAGFGTTRESIPSGIRKAIRMLATHWFNTRETVSPEGKKPGEQVEFGLKNLAGRYRFHKDHS